MANKTKQVSFENYLIKRDSTEAFLHYYCSKHYLRRLRTRRLRACTMYRIGLLSTQRFHSLLLKDLIQGMPQKRFERIAKEFAVSFLDPYVNMLHVNRVLQLKSEGYIIEVQSKGMEEWVRPWCDKFGLLYVQASKACMDENKRLTGEIVEPSL